MKWLGRKTSKMWKNREYGAARFGNYMFNSRRFGAKSRWFGHKHSGAPTHGILNRPGKNARWSIGWSGRSVKVNGKNKARTVFRMKLNGWKFDLRHGPWR
jgi:hypothetical protein